MYATDDCRIEEIKISRIKPEPTPLKQEKLLKQSLFNDDDEPEQWEEIKLREIDHPDYDFQYINGRRRGETLRSQDVKTVRAIIVNNVDDKDLHIGALIGNSGRPNPGDEANHIWYLHHDLGMEIKDIAKKINYKRQRVELYVRLKKNLSPTAFDMLLDGTINFSTACELARMNGRDQTSFIRKQKKNDEPVSNKKTKEEYKRLQGKNINTLIGDLVAPEIPKHVTLTSEMIKNLLNDIVIEIVWENEKICIARCEI